MTTRAVAALVGVALAAPWRLTAQVGLGVAATATSYEEDGAGGVAQGFGVEGSGTYRWGRVRIALRIRYASLTPDDTGRASFGLTGLDARAVFPVTPRVAVEVGLGRRLASPTFAAADVAFAQLGVRSEVRLSRLALVWVYVALIPVTRFGTGGSSALSGEAGFGTAVNVGGRWHVTAGYDLQRIARDVQGLALPVQVGVTRIGVDWRH